MRERKSRKEKMGPDKLEKPLRQYLEESKKYLKL
jgi:hypothetical protein